MTRTSNFKSRNLRRSTQYDFLSFSFHQIYLVVLRQKHSTWHIAKLTALTTYSRGGRICGTHTFKEHLTGRLSRPADENSFKRAF
ncbi:MAG: hypothetical protein CBC97_00285 [Verrucomicrobiaceae bacterium TMED137]|nr:MAG: hypothetical protein CBC97_00285 [Verrucomicrobiaceae bacterium TMED137]HAE20227.1 hypothetical protein [Verrucomicrobiales bacterium]